MTQVMFVVLEALRLGRLAYACCTLLTTTGQDRIEEALKFPKVYVVSARVARLS